MTTPTASLLLVASISLALACMCGADLINDVCSRAQSPSVCNQALRPDPRSRGADLRGLGRIAIEKSLAAVQETKTVAKSFATGPTKGKAGTCIETCGDAVDNLNECAKLLAAHDKFSINTLQTKGSAALTDVGTCDDEFGAGEPPNLKQASQRAQSLIDVLLVIANLLAA